MKKDSAIQYKTMSIKAESDDLREFTAIITDESVDRDNEVLLASGMNKKEFLKNGIILFNHDPNQPIGTATSIRRSGDGWKATGRIAEGVQKAEDVWQLLKQGILKAVSVGFKVDEMRAPTKKDIAEFGKDITNVISKWTLLEYSVVSIGANQNALVLGTKDMSINAKDILGDDYVEPVEIVKEDNDIEVSNIIEEVEEKLKKMDIELEEELKKMDIEIETVTKEKIIEVVKNKDIDYKEVLFYFKEEVQKNIRKSRGELF